MVEGGAHGHALMREQRATSNDGAHAHVFVLPDGRVIITGEDGGHQHALTDPFASVTGVDGLHTHEAPGVGPTQPGGTHAHELGVWSTNQGGNHQHILVVDGVTLESLTPGELFERAGLDGTIAPVPKSASALASITTTSMAAVQSEELAATALRLAKLWARNFSGTSLEIVGKLRRGLVLEAAAAVSEIWAARAGAPPEGALFTEAKKYLAAPRRVTMQLRHPGGLELVFDSGRGLVLDTWRSDPLPSEDAPTFLKRAGSRISPDGDRLSNPWRAPHTAKVAAFDQPAEGQVHRLTLGTAQIEEGLPGEWFVTKGPVGFNGALRVEKTSDGQLYAGLDIVPVPRVLWASSATAKLMPEAGKSGLPACLEQDVPAEFRFWKVADPIQAMAVRDALIESELFSVSTVKLVNGEPRRIHVQLSLAGPCADGSPVIPVHKSAVERAAELLPDLGLDTGVASGVLRAQLLASVEWSELVKSVERTGATFMFDATVAKDVPADVVADRLVGYVGDYLVAYPDSAEARASLGKLGRVFKLHVGHEGLIFVASAAPIAGAIDWIDSPTITKAVGRPVSLLKATALAPTDAPQEERYALGVVLEPGVVDSQNDTYDEKAVADAAHRFMEEYGNVGLMHTSIINGQVKILESYVTPADFTIGAQFIRKGTWMLAVRVLSDVLWKEVKSGGLTGFSIGGSAIKVPLAGTPPPRATPSGVLIPAAAPAPTVTTA